MGIDAVYKKQKHWWTVWCWKSLQDLKKQKKQKKTLQTECLKCFETFLAKINCQWKTAHKKKTSTYWVFLTCLCIFYSIYWFTLRLLGNLLPVSKELSSSAILMSILPPPVLFDPQPSAPDLFSYWSHNNTRPFSSIPLWFSDSNCAKNIQHGCNIYRFLQVHLAPLSAWNGFSVRSGEWRGGGFGRWKMREEQRLRDWGGIWPDRAVMKWKDELENLNILMWKAGAAACSVACVVLVTMQAGANILQWFAFTELPMEKQISTNKYDLHLQSTEEFYCVYPTSQKCNISVT